MQYILVIGGTSGARGCYEHHSREEYLSARTRREAIKEAAPHIYRFEKENRCDAYAKLCIEVEDNLEDRSEVASAMHELKEQDIQRRVAEEEARKEKKRQDDWVLYKRLEEYFKDDPGA